MDEIKGFDAEVLQTSLSKEDAARLKAAFGAEELARDRSFGSGRLGLPEYTFEKYQEEWT
jgi:hypothetical protein